ncbi:MAG: hypothetical protein LBG45_04445 [Dysgonamonadaceae bacterium]|nr:hypothetical protein [Dysgonamonadaceae bacterium]
MDELIIPPLSLNLITTNKCTATCLNCCLQCSPENNDRLSLQEMVQYVDSSIETYDTIKLLILTGGECFTLGKDLDSIVQYASNKGLMVRVVTNGYWATSSEKAFARLKKLADAGLLEFNLSTGDEHQNWVPYDNIIWATVAALELKLSVAINVETSMISQFDERHLKTDPRLEKYKLILNEKLKVISGIWILFHYCPVKK